MYIWHKISKRFLGKQLYSLTGSLNKKYAEVTI